MSERVYLTNLTLTFLADTHQHTHTLTHTHTHAHTMAPHIRVESPGVRYTQDNIEADYTYNTTSVWWDSKGTLVATPTSTTYTFRTQRKVSVRVYNNNNNNNNKRFI